MALRDQIENMSPREKRLLMVLGGVFAFIVFIGIPAYFYLNLADAREHNQSIRDALDEMDKMSELLAKRRQERVAREQRYLTPAPPLAAFIEGAAEANGLEVPESTDRPDVPGKGYTERVTVVKMKKVGLTPIVKMLERIERSGYPVSITQLTITTRATGPDLYDVTLMVSAYDKQGAPPSEGADAKGKGSANAPSKPPVAPPAPKGKTPFLQKVPEKGGEL